MQEPKTNPRHSRNKRPSMAEIYSQIQGQFDQITVINGSDQNSSIERKNSKKSQRQVQSAKTIGLTFNSSKSKKTIYESTLKENKQSHQNIGEGALKFSSPKPTRKKNAQNRYSGYIQNENPPGCEFSLSTLEKEIKEIIECPVKAEAKRLSRQQFIFLNQLGEGVYSSVKLAIQRSSNTVCAIKEIKEQVLLQKDNFQRLVSQIKIQSFCQHKNIAKIYGYFSDFSDKPTLSLIQQYVGGQTLFSLMFKQGYFVKMDLKDVVSYISQLCQAISYLHRHSIIHRDIKPENILIAPGGVVKLIDFGCAVYNPQKQNLRKTICGTPLYLSPEIIAHQYYDQRVDVWAVGVLTYELLTGSNPFNIQDMNQLQKIITHQAIMSKIDDKDAKDFVSKMLIKDRQYRWPMHQLCKHTFLAQKYQKSKLE